MRGSPGSPDWTPGGIVVGPPRRKTPPSPKLFFLRHSSSAAEPRANLLMNNEDLYKRKLEPEEALETFHLQENNGSANNSALELESMKSSEEVDRVDLLPSNPPAKRFRGTEELDIRFLISSRVAISLH